MTHREVVQINDAAAAVIRDCGRYIQKLAHVHGESSPHAAATAVSWSRAIGEAIGMTAGGGSLSRDGARSLYGITAYGMNFGVIFRPDGRFREVMSGPDHALMCLNHGQPAKDMDSKECCGVAAAGYEQHADLFCYVADAPVPGEWTMHS